MVIVKHVNMQQKLEVKRHITGSAQQIAVDRSMLGQAQRIEGKKERERQVLLAEKAALKAAKKPKKPQEEVE